MGKRWTRYLPLLLLISFSAQAEFIDLPNPFDENPSVEKPPSPLVEPAPELSSQHPVSPQEREKLGRFSGNATITGITRKTKGLVYRLDVRPAVSIHKIAISVNTSQLALHESYVITESGQRIKIQEFSRSAVIANKATAFSEELILRERISAIDLRAESMGAESDIEVVAYSDDAIAQLQLLQKSPTALPASSSAQVICRWNGKNNQPFNVSNNIFLGKVGYGFADMETCQDSVQKIGASGGFAVCSWSGENWTIYRTSDGLQIGRIDFGYRYIEECHKAIADASNGLLCNWNGSGFSSYVISGISNVGKYGYGLAEYSICADNNKSAHQGLLCQWNGSNYQPYVISTNESIGRIDFGYEHLGACQKALQTVGAGFVCNWDGEGYTRYSLKNSQGVAGRNFKTLEGCMATKY